MYGIFPRTGDSMNSLFIRPSRMIPANGRNWIEIKPKDRMPITETFQSTGRFNLRGRHSTTKMNNMIR